MLLFNVLVGDGNKDKIDLSFKEQQAGDDIDYQGAVHEILANPLPGLQVLDLAGLQARIAKNVLANDKIVLMHGITKLADTAVFPNIQSITISNLSSNTDVTLTPDLIVVAEGAHSSTRESLGIKLEQLSQTQTFCSGSVKFSKECNVR